MRIAGKVPRGCTPFFASVATTAIRVAIVAGVLAGAPAVTRAQVIGSEPEARAPLGITAGLGLRSDLIRSSGLDPFSTGDDLHQSALSIGYRFGPTEGLGLALAFEWNHGVASANARAASGTLTVDRLSLGFEGRATLWRRLSGFARIAPALLRSDAQLREDSTPAGTFGGGETGVLTQTKWVPAADASAGLALRLAEVRGRGSPTFGFWLTAEAGYGYAGAFDLVLAPQVEAEPGRVDEPVRLGRLALRGGFMRARFAVSF